jgi:hypothetical protein
VAGPLRRQSRRQARGRRRFADGGSSRAALPPVAPLHRRAVAIRDHTAARPCAAWRGRELHHHGCGQLGTGSRRSRERRKSHSLGRNGDVRRPCARGAARHHSLCHWAALAPWR